MTFETLVLPCTSMRACVCIHSSPISTRSSLEMVIQALASRVEQSLLHAQQLGVNCSSSQPHAHSSGSHMSPSRMGVTVNAKPSPECVCLRLVPWVSAAIPLLSLPCCCCL